MSASQVLWGSPNLGVDIRDFLNRAPLTRATVTRGDYAAIRALSQILDVFVLAVDDERLADRGDLVSVGRDSHDDNSTSFATVYALESVVVVGIR